MFEGVTKYLEDAILTACCVPAITIFRCFKSAIKNNQLLDWQKYPPVSMLGYLKPQRRIYVIGFCITAAAILLMSFIYHIILFPSMKNTPRKIKVMNAFAFVLSLLAAGGLAGQAILPLQEDFHDVVVGTAHTNTQSKIHQLFAVVLFVAAFFHSILTMLILESIPLKKLRSALFRLIRIIILVIFGLALVASTVFHPTSEIRDSDPEKYHKMFNFGGITQYAVLISMIAFIATYYKDAKNLVNSHGNLDNVDFAKKDKKSD